MANHISSIVKSRGFYGQLQVFLPFVKQIVIFLVTLHSTMSLEVLPGTSASSNEPVLCVGADILAGICASSLPRNCANCYITHLQFYVTYFGYPDKVISLLQEHGVTH